MQDRLFRLAFGDPRILEDRRLASTPGDAYARRYGRPLACRLRLYQTVAGYVLVVTDLGYGITQSIDAIAEAIVRRWEIDPATLTVIEHYDYGQSRRRAGEPRETFAIVAFEWERITAKHPTWNATTREDVELLTGSTLW
jgi:hypothetical protein